jgi:hypothetical protein
MKSLTKRVYVTFQSGAEYDMPFLRLLWLLFAFKTLPDRLVCCQRWGLRGRDSVTADVAAEFRSLAAQIEWCRLFLSLHESQNEYKIRNGNGDEMVSKHVQLCDGAVGINTRVELSRPSLHYI